MAVTDTSENLDVIVLNTDDFSELGIDRVFLRLAIGAGGEKAECGDDEDRIEGIARGCFPSKIDHENSAFLFYLTHGRTDREFVKGILCLQDVKINWHD